MQLGSAQIQKCRSQLEPFRRNQWYVFLHLRYPMVGSASGVSGRVRWFLTSNFATVPYRKPGHVDEFWACRSGSSRLSCAHEHRLHSSIPAARCDQCRLRSKRFPYRSLHQPVSSVIHSFALVEFSNESYPRYIEAYTDPNLTTWRDDFKQPFPKNSFLGQC